MQPSTVDTKRGPTFVARYSRVQEKHGFAIFKKKSLPTDPKFFGFATGNEYFLNGLIACLIYVCEQSYNYFVLLIIL